MSTTHAQDGKKHRGLSPAVFLRFLGPAFLATSLFLSLVDFAHATKSATNLVHASVEEPAPTSPSSEAAHYEVDATSEGRRASAPDFLDLGTIRYLSPQVPRELWLGLDIGGVYMPDGFIANFGRDVWMARVTFPWALALTPWLSVGGRHELAWYDAENVRAQYSNQEISLSVSPTSWRALPGVTQDRLEFGFEALDMFRTTLFGDDGLRQVLHLGGIFDRVIYVGYGMSHRVRPKLSVDWNTQGRFVWVFINTQKHLRTSVRLRWNPRRAHTFSIESVGFLIFREKIQAGNLLPRAGIVGQFAAQYDWMSKRKVGLFARAWFSTSFLSGTSPVFEIREEAINQPYGELSMGLRARW